MISQSGDVIEMTLADIDHMLALLELCGRDTAPLRAQRESLIPYVDAYRHALEEQTDAERKRSQIIQQLWKQISILHGTHQEFAMTADEIFARHGAAGEPIADALRGLANAIQRFAQLSARQIETS